MSEYPKALNVKTMDQAGVVRIVPVVWPPGHEHQGLAVVFRDSAEELAYDGSGVVFAPVVTATTEHVAQVIRQGADYHPQPAAQPPGLRGEVTVRVA